MRQAIAFTIALTSAASGVLAALPRVPGQIANLGFGAGNPSTNNRGDVAGANGLWTARGLIELGTVPGGDRFTAWAINNRRQVVGWGPDALGFSRAFLWDDGVFTDLGTLGGRESLAFDINNGGHIAGVARTAADEVHGFLWTDGVMRDLGPVAFVLGINNRDQVVGAAFAPSGQLQAFVWSGGSVTFLGTLPGASDSFAEDINDRGQIVGWAGVATGSRPLLWDRGVMIELETLPGGTGALAAEINNRGQIVGWGDTASGELHGILWQEGVALDLGLLPGATYSIATSINERGDIVGVSGNAVVRWTRR